MKKIKLWLYNFIQQIVSEEVTFDVLVKINGKIICKLEMYRVPTTGEKLRVIISGNENIFKVLEVVSYPSGAVLDLHGVFIKSNNNRAFATYLTNNKFTCISNAVANDLTGTALIQDINNDMMHIKNEYAKAIENLPALVQIAEMYHDSMIGRCEESMPFELVSQTLKNLINE